MCFDVGNCEGWYEGITSDGVNGTFVVNCIVDENSNGSIVVIVGENEGNFEMGMCVGEFEGERVGLFDGLYDGVFVGNLIGESVGDVVVIISLHRITIFLNKIYSLLELTSIWNCTLKSTFASTDDMLY
eukprot:195761_1